MLNSMILPLDIRRNITSKIHPQYTVKNAI